jgi:hypothetical protein
LRTRTVLAGIGIALAASLETLSVRPARADGPQDAAIAEALFQDGRTLLSQGRTAEACNKFASSQRVDPQIGTMLFLATCHEEEGKTATAWAEFEGALGALQKAPDPRREAYAREHHEALSTKLSRLLLTAASPVTGFVVKVDDESFDAGGLGTPLPLDPGLHTVTATAPLRRRWSTTLRIAEGPIDVALTIPPLETVAPDPIRTEPPEGPPPPAALKPLKPMDPAPDDHGSGRTLAYTAGAVGLAGLIVGSVAGIWALVDKTHADHGSCVGNLCTQHGLDLYSEATTAGWVSTGGFSVAAVGLGVGAGAWIASEHAKPAAPPVHGAGLSIAGVW